MAQILEFASYDKRAIKALDAGGVSIDVVYDIGASNACWSGQVATELGKGQFHMFEPLNRSYVEVRDWWMKTQPGLVFHNIGLGSETGEILFNIPDHDHSSSFLGSPANAKERLSVPVWRLDDYCAHHAIPAPDFVKMDTQGFELEILKGGEKVLSQAKGMLLETWLYRGYGPGTPLLTELTEWLQPRGFVVAGMGDLYYSPRNILTAIDLLVLRADIAAALPEETHRAIQASYLP